MTAGPARSPMVAAFAVATLVTLELVLVEVAVHSHVDVVIGVALALAIVLGMALAGLAAAAVAELVRRLRLARRRQVTDRRFDAQLRTLSDDELEHLARLVGVLDDDSRWDR